MSAFLEGCGVKKILADDYDGVDDGVVDVDDVVDDGELGC